MSSDLKPKPDDRSPLAVGLEWSTRLISVGVCMVLPLAGGFWLDHWLGTLPWFALGGGIFGMTAGIWQFIGIVRELAPNKGPAPPGD